MWINNSTTPTSPNIQKEHMTEKENETHTTFVCFRHVHGRFLSSVFVFLDLLIQLSFKLLQRSNSPKFQNSTKSGKEIVQILILAQKLNCLYTHDTNVQRCCYITLDFSCKHIFQGRILAKPWNITTQPFEFPKIWSKTWKLMKHIWTRSGKRQHSCISHMRPDFTYVNVCWVTAYMHSHINV